MKGAESSGQARGLALIIFSFLVFVALFIPLSLSLSPSLPPSLLLEADKGVREKTREKEANPRTVEGEQEPGKERQKDREQVKEKEKREKRIGRERERERERDRERGRGEGMKKQQGLVLRLCSFLVLLSRFISDKPRRAALEEKGEEDW